METALQPARLSTCEILKDAAGSQRDVYNPVLGTQSEVRVRGSWSGGRGFHENPHRS